MAGGGDLIREGGSTHWAPTLRLHFPHYAYSCGPTVGPSYTPTVGPSYSPTAVEPPAARWAPQAPLPPDPNQPPATPAPAPAPHTPAPHTEHLHLHLTHLHLHRTPAHAPHTSAPAPHTSHTCTCKCLEQRTKEFLLERASQLLVLRFHSGPTPC